MRKLVLTLLAFFLSITVSNAQNLKSARVQSDNVFSQKELTKKIIYSNAKTNGSMCMDTVWYTLYKSRYLLSNPMSTYFYLMPIVSSTYGTLLPGQIFPANDSMKVYGVGVYMSANKNGLPPSMVTGGSGLYTDGDTLQVDIELVSVDTTGGNLQFGGQLGVTTLNFVIDTAMGSNGVYISSKIVYGTFSQPIDVTNLQYYAFRGIKKGGKNDSLLFWINSTTDGTIDYDSPLPWGGILTYQGNWYLGADLGVNADYIFLPIVEHNLYTDFIIPDSINSGDTLRPQNTSHKAYLEPVYNLADFVDYYWDSLNLAAWSAGAQVRQARPFWSWGPTGAIDYAFPDTAYYVYNESQTTTYNVSLNNILIAYSNGSAGCPLPNNPQTTAKSLVVYVPVKVFGKTINVKIFPNPASDYVAVDLQNISADVALFNLQGQQVYAKKATGVVNIPVSELPNGTYILKVITNEGVSSTKINIKH